MEIINRENQIALAEDLISSVSNGWKLDKTVIEFTGIMGAGKSILLRRIREISREYKTQTVFLDFGGPQYQEKNDLLIKLNLVQSLLEQINLDLRSTSSLSEGLRKCMLSQDSVETDVLIEILVSTIISSSIITNCVFIIDSLDRLNSDLVIWFEKKFVEPLVINQSSSLFGFIIGCRYSIKWENYNIRKTTESVALPPFSKDNTVKQLSTYVNSSLAERLHEITGGFPAFNEFVAQKTQRELENRTLTDEEFKDFEARLTRDLVSTIIQRDIVRSTGIDFQIVQYICVSILSDEEIIKKILEKFFPNTPRTNSWVDRFITNKLLAWNEEKIRLASWENGGYVINPVVRKTLSLDLRLNKTDVYEEITNVLVDCMYDRLKTKFHPDESILEIVFHKANLLSLNNQEYIDGLSELFKNLIVQECKGKTTGLNIARDVKARLTKFEDLRIRLGNDIKRLETVIDDFIADETSEQEKSMQKAILAIHREASQPDKDIYDLSLNIPGEAKDRTEKLEVPRAIRTTILQKLREELSSKAIEEIGRNVYGNFLPQHWRDLLFKSRNPVCISSDDNEIPWEFSFDGTNYLSRVQPLSRVMRIVDEMEAGLTSRSKSKRILLIANPTEDENLKYTEDEVNEIAKYAQRANFIPEILIGSNANIYKVSSEINSGDYKIIHYAGHAYFDDTESFKSGLLLYDGQYSASSILNNIKGNPFVFLNACYSGKLNAVEINSWRVGPQTWGIASAFIQKGAVGCIGSLWRISDEASRKFSTQFYQSAFLGLPIGIALRDTRNSFELQTLDWASYVMYGDPLYKF